MDLQFSGKVCECLQSVVWENKTEELTQEVRLPDGVADVGTILGAWGQILVRSKEWREKQICISGGVTGWAVCCPENGGMPETVEVWIPFNLKWDLPENNRDGTAHVSFAVRSMDARCVSARRIMFQCTVSVTAEGLIPSQMETFTARNVPDDVNLLNKSYPVRLPKEAGEKVFVLDEEYNLPASADDACKLVRCCVHPEIVDKKVMGDKAVFRGAAIVDMLFLCQQGNLAKHTFEIPFSQFAELDAEYGPAASLWMDIALSSVEPELLEDKTVRVKAGLIGQYTVHDTTMVDVIEDAYSTCRDVQLQTGMLTLPAILEEKQELIKAEQAVNDLMPLDAAMMLGQPAIYHEDEKACIELGGTFRVVGNDMENGLCGKTAAWNDSMEMSITRDSKVLALAKISGQPQLIQTADGTLIKQDVLVEARTVSTTGIPMVTGISMGEVYESDENRPSLILCRAENSLWEIAKKHGSTVEAIKEANGITEETVNGKMLLIPIG